MSVAGSHGSTEEMRDAWALAPGLLPMTPPLQVPSVFALPWSLSVAAPLNSLVKTGQGKTLETIGNVADKTGRCYQIVGL